MKAFEYAEPRTEAEAVGLLHDAPGSTEILAGGTDLVGLMNKSVVQPDRLVNIMEIPSLKGIELDEQGNLVIGATETLDQILAHPQLANYRAITDAILGINSMQLQAQGTLGGEVLQRPNCWLFRSGQGLLPEPRSITSGNNELHAILANDSVAKFVSSSRIAPALIAYQAQARIIGPGNRVDLVPVEALFRIPASARQRENTLKAGQLVTHFILPPAERISAATYEVRASAGPDFPTAAAAVALHTQGTVVQAARVVLGQVAPIPFVSREAERSLIGQEVNEHTAQQAGEEAVRIAQPLSHNAYKVAHARVAVKRALLLAAGLETGGF